MSLVKLGEFSAHYDGPALDDHEMDVTTLGPALLSFGYIVRAVHKGLYPLDKAVPTVRVQEFKPGSFEVLMVIDLPLIDNLAGFFTSQKATAVVNASAMASPIVVAIAWVARKIKAKATGNDTETIDELITQAGDEIASKVIDELANDKRVIEHYKQVVKPLETNDIEEFTLKGQDGSVLETVNEIEAEHILNFEVPEAPTVRRETCIVEIGTPQIAKPMQRKWRLEHDAYGSISATLLDEDFATMVVQGKVNFHSGALFKALLRVEELDVEGEPEPRRKFEIITIKPVPTGEQTTLFDEDH